MLLGPQQVGFSAFWARNGILPGSNWGTPMLTVTWFSPSSCSTMRYARRADRDAIPVDQPLEAHETGETAGTVAALLHLAAIGIEDAVVKVKLGIIGRLHQQQLVEADAEVAIRQLLDDLIAEKHLLGDAIHHHEVVPQPVHLGKIYQHRAFLYPCSRSHLEERLEKSINNQGSKCSPRQRSANCSRSLMRNDCAPSTSTSAARGRVL